MGNAVPAEQPDRNELTTIPLTIENAPQDDPLSHYIRHRSTFDVKTLADVHTSSLKAAQAKRLPPIALTIANKEN
jgi:hypothetical protein